MPKETIQQIEERLADLSTRIKALEARLDEVDRRRHESHRREIHALLDQRARAANKLAELRRAEAESWVGKNLQSGIFEIFDDIGHRIDRLMSGLDKDQRP